MLEQWTFRRGGAAVLVLLAILVGCSGPGVAPSIGGLTVAPDAITIDVGESVELEVSFVDVVGQPDLAVSWVSSVEAFATVEPGTARRATVTGAGAGTATVTVASTFDPTKTAVATVTVVAPDPEPPATITVEGRLRAWDGRPLPSVQVHAQGRLTATDGDGAFTLAGIEPPYTLVVGSDGAEPWVHVYEDLTMPDPVLAPITSQLPFLNGEVSGTVAGGATLPSDHAVAVAVEGRDFHVFGEDVVGGGAISYGNNTAWRGSANAPVRLHALRMLRNPAGMPIAFLGYDDSVEVELKYGQPVVANVLPSGVVGDTHLSGTIDPSGGTLFLTTVLVRINRFAHLRLHGSALGLAAVDMAFPDIGEGVAVVGASALFGVGTSLLWATLPPAQAFALVMPVPPVAFAPADGFDAVDAATEFRAVGGPTGARVYRWLPEGSIPGPRVALSTTRDIVTLPQEIGALGLALAPAGSYRWSTGVVVGDDFETALRIPPEFPEFGFLVPGIPEDGAALAWSAYRDMKLAP